MDYTTYIYIYTFFFFYFSLSKSFAASNSHETSSLSAIKSLLRFPPLDNAVFYYLTPPVISEFSGAHQKLVVWLVVLVRIAAAVEFLD